MINGGLPLFDSHTASRTTLAASLKPVLAWRASEAYWFKDTERGQLAEGIVARGEIKDISAG
jgi:hypothetical protein